MGINLYEIQPGEDELTKETVDYFMNHSDSLFDRTNQIKIFVFEGQPFRYSCASGNARLYVCHRLGITEIPIEPKNDERDYEAALDAALENFNKGIRTWSDLDDKIVPARKSKYNKPSLE